MPNLSLRVAFLLDSGRCDAQATIEAGPLKDAENVTDVAATNPGGTYPVY